MDSEEEAPLMKGSQSDNAANGGGEGDLYDNTDINLGRNSSSHELNRATERVQFLLGKGQDPDTEGEGHGHSVHDVFCQLDELHHTQTEGDVIWKEAARWVKFEEDVEEGGERWSKPYVATLSLHSLYEVRETILKCTIMLDVEAQNFFQLTDMLLSEMIKNNQLDADNKELVQEVLLSKHKHLHDKKKKKSMSHNLSFDDVSTKGKLSRRSSIPTTPTTPPDGTPSNMHRFGRRGSVEVGAGNLLPLPRSSSSKSGMTESPSASKISSVIGGIQRDASGNELYQSKFNKDFLRKIPAGAEAANILVGEVDFLEEPICAFIRLNKPLLFGEITEVPVHTRFVFLMLGPAGNMKAYHQVGRAYGTLMSDEIFHGVMYKARDRKDILAALDEFLDQTTVLPPGEWDPTIRIEPPKSVPSQDKRRGVPQKDQKKRSIELNREAKEKMERAKAKVLEQDEEVEGHADPTLERTGKLFGGLRGDIARKMPYFISDITDGIHLQCIASLFFMYFACLTPIITFGGLLGAATDNNLAAMESLLAGAICGISYHMFSGQPLTIIGSTGPVLVFETIVYNFSMSTELNYLSFRFWIGIWISLALMMMVAFDLSALVKYITRFTEESFAMLISLIFIVESFKKLFHILDHAAVNLNPDVELNHTCNCLEPNITEDYNSSTTAAPVNWTALDPHHCEEHHGILEGPGCHLPHYVADVFFFSCLLFIGTFLMAIKLKALKTSRFFPTKVRTMMANFGVMASIVCMAGTDMLIGLDTPKLLVPSTFKPTRDDRGWVINPFVNPVWCIGAAVPPAILATILIFMDQQITAVIVNRKENLLKKGGGYHLDLFIIAIQIAVNSVLGLPWFVAATVLSINHVVSLSQETESAAPGERPKFLGIREQRVTGVITFILVGLSVFMTDVLAMIPMAVLYGVFLYMGVSALTGVQLVQRVSIVFMPQKYQPDYVFLRHVTIKKTHLFTLIQIICLAMLWTIKSIKSISIIFPLMVLAMCFVRKALDRVFSQRELKWLDDIMPEIHKKEKEDKTKKILAQIEQDYEEERRKNSVLEQIEEENDDPITIKQHGANWSISDNNNDLKHRKNGQLDVSFKEEDEINCSSV